LQVQNPINVNLLLKKENYRMHDKIWGFMTHLSGNTWINGKNAGIRSMVLEDEMLDFIIEEGAKAGFNTLILEVNDGLEYGTHPEISVKGAWSRKKLRDTIKRCREKGITVMPELNLSAAHDMWLGAYERMRCTPQYYRLVDDLIKEVYELFEHPKYIHLGMDEEDAKHLEKRPYAMYRQKDLYWHDLRFMMDSVICAGATPWIWSCPLFDHPEEFKKHIDAEEVVISPWYFNAFRKEHWTPVESRAEYVAYYNEGDYAKLGIKYVEEDPFLVNVREKAIPLTKEGYRYIPCASVYNRCEYNACDLMEYFKDNAPDDQILGYITAPWYGGEMKNKAFFQESFDTVKAAREIIYGK